MDDIMEHCLLFSRLNIAPRLKKDWTSICPTVRLPHWELQEMYVVKRSAVCKKNRHRFQTLPACSLINVNLINRQFLRGKLVFESVADSIFAVRVRSTRCWNTINAS